MMVWCGVGAGAGAGRVAMGHWDWEYSKLASLAKRCVSWRLGALYNCLTTAQ